MNDELRRLQPGEIPTLHFALRANGDTQVYSSFGHAPNSFPLGGGSLTPNL